MPAATEFPAPVHTVALWHVQLLGGLRARRGDTVLANLGSRGVGALLARLALSPQSSHAREALIDLLWPGVELDTGRNRLRQALFTLRQLLEPPGPVTAPVLIADRLSVRVVGGAIDCDVARFERCVRDGHPAQAIALYTGELLPGFYDAWIDDERLRLAALFERATAALPMRPPQPATLPPIAAAPAAPAAPVAPVAPVEVGRSTFPVYLTRFFGRDADGARLRAEVLGHRLVTLLGPGGSGKTRLAVELAAALRDGGLQGDERFSFVAFVPLAGCTTRPQVLDALLAALHLRQHDDDPLSPLVAVLAGRRALLVLDNFEQLSGVAEDVVARLATLMPELHLLVTSRRVLGLDGEREVAIPPLDLPGAHMPLDEAAINPAVALFVDRARAVRANFHLGPTNLGAVVELVHLLEGMPLAIELAAARVRSIAPAAMAGLLRGARALPTGLSLQLLHRGGPRSGGDRRHASMLSVIEWSWRLLEPAQAQLLAALTVFHGGFSADAAQAVCGALALLADVRLDELVSHSLLRAAEGPGGAMRYTSFEPVREYAALQLDAEAARALRRQHRAWLTAWADALPATPDLAEARVETPNLLAALAGALADDVPGAAIEMMLPLRRVLEDVELPAEGLAALATALDRCADATLRSRGHTLLGPLLFIAGRRDEALRHAELGLAGAPLAAPTRSRALYAAARVRWRIRHDATEVLPLLDEAEPLALATADDELLASVVALRAFVANGQQQYANGEALHAQALALWERQGNEHAVNSGRYNLAVCAQDRGRHEEALQSLALIEPSARALQDWRRVSQVLNVRGNALCGLRRWPEAAATFRESAQLAWDCLALHELAYVLWNLPRALAHVREAERALQLAGFAESFWQTRFGQLGAADRHDMRRVRRLAACSLDARQIPALWARGARLSLADALALALR